MILFSLLFCGSFVGLLSFRIQFDAKWEHEPPGPKDSRQKRSRCVTSRCADNAPPKSIHSTPGPTKHQAFCTA